ncbi:hypothetical protein [Leifsonia sp. NPDC077715]|uniref:hypothetical protein n=1 Tax=Leifsonia sp. NPDC077715 TaxID=3155539 RepID=UPI00343371C2
MRDDTAPQLGQHDIDRATLSERGTSLAALLAELGLDVVVPPDAPPDAPPDGWRVLTPGEPEGASMLLGTPARDDGSAWRVAQPSGATGGPAQLNVHPDILPLRPSVAERRAGLVLRWPTVTRDLLDVDALAVDIVNEGAERWMPSGDGLPAFAALVPVGSESAPYFFGFTVGSDLPVPLDPGEYRRTLARVDASSWERLHPGPHRVTAFSPFLRLTSPETLTIHLTAEVIAAHRRQPAHSVPEPQRPRELAEERLRIVRAMRVGRDAFPRLADAIRDLRDDERALSRIQDILGCAYDEAQAVYNLQLRRARVGYPDVLALEIEALEQELATPGDDEGAAPVE